MPTDNEICIGSFTSKKQYFFIFAMRSPFRQLGNMEGTRVESRYSRGAWGGGGTCVESYQVTLPPALIVFPNISRHSIHLLFFNINMQYNKQKKKVFFRFKFIMTGQGPLVHQKIRLLLGITGGISALRSGQQASNYNGRTGRTFAPNNCQGICRYWRCTYYIGFGLTDFCILLELELEI